MQFCLLLGLNLQLPPLNCFLIASVVKTNSISWSQKVLHKVIFFFDHLMGACLSKSQQLLKDSLPGLLQHQLFIQLNCFLNSVADRFDAWLPSNNAQLFLLHSNHSESLQGIFCRNSSGGHNVFPKTHLHYWLLLFFYLIEVVIEHRDVHPFSSLCAETNNASICVFGLEDNFH